MAALIGLAFVGADHVMKKKKAKKAAREAEGHGQVQEYNPQESGIRYQQQNARQTQQPQVQQQQQEQSPTYSQQQSPAYSQQPQYQQQSPPYSQQRQEQDRYFETSKAQLAEQERLRDTQSSYSGANASGSHHPPPYNEAPPHYDNTNFSPIGQASESSRRSSRSVSPIEEEARRN